MLRESLHSHSLHSSNACSSLGNFSIMWKTLQMWMSHQRQNLLCVWHNAYHSNTHLTELHTSICQPPRPHSVMHFQHFWSLPHQLMTLACVKGHSQWATNRMFIYFLESQCSTRQISVYIQLPRHHRCPRLFVSVMRWTRREGKQYVCWPPWPRWKEPRQMVQKHGNWQHLKSPSLLNMLMLHRFIVHVVSLVYTTLYRKSNQRSIPLKITFHCM